MKKRQKYILKLYDNELARFDIVSTPFGETNFFNLEVDETQKHLLPPNIKDSPSESELQRFVNARRIPAARPYIVEILQAMGIHSVDTKTIIDATRGMSINDSYSIVPEEDRITFAEVNLFDNAFDDVLQVVALTGHAPHPSKGVGLPSVLADSGQFPKAWRRINDDLYLYKAGSTRNNPGCGLEPYAELFAYKALYVAGLNATPYWLEQWHEKTCSVCKLFNNKSVSFVPFYLCMSQEKEENMTVLSAIEFASQIDAVARNEMVDMFVVDAAIANQDRHMGNFGFLRDNASGEFISLAPMFDHNLSMYINKTNAQLEVSSLDESLRYYVGPFDNQLVAQAEALADEYKPEWLNRLRDVNFSFKQLFGDMEPVTTSPDTTLDQKRVEAAFAQVRRVSSALLKPQGLSGLLNKRIPPTRTILPQSQRGPKR